MGCSASNAVDAAPSMARLRSFSPDAPHAISRMDTARITTAPLSSGGGGGSGGGGSGSGEFNSEQFQALAELMDNGVQTGAAIDAVKMCRQPAKLMSLLVREPALVENPVAAATALNSCNGSVDAAVALLTGAGGRTAQRRPSSSAAQSQAERAQAQAGANTFWEAVNSALGPGQRQGASAAEQAPDQLPNMGRELLLNATGGESSERSITDRVTNTIKDARAGTMDDQLKLLRKINPGYAHSGRWEMEVTSSGTSYRRRECEQEALVDTDVFVNISEVTSGHTVMEIKGWRRSFNTGFFGGSNLEFVPAKTAVKMFTNRNNGFNSLITSEATAEVSRMKNSSLRDKKMWFEGKATSLLLPWSDRKEFEVRRAHVFQDSCSALLRMPVRQWRAPFNIKFSGESGLDAGGLTREWFQMVLDHAFHSDTGMFKFAETDNLTYQFNEASMASPDHYRLVGLVLGKALLEGHAIGVHFTVPLLKMIANSPVTWKDMAFKTEAFFNSMLQLLDMKPEDIQYLCLDFTVPDARNKERVYPLKPGGENIPVTGDNVKDFIQLAATYKLLDSIAPMLGALLSGLFDVVPELYLMVFDFPELELLLGGVPTIDIEDWEANTTVTSGGSSSASQRRRIRQWFFRMLRGWEHEKRAALLQFVTGTTQVPIGGFKRLQGHMGEIKPFEIKVTDYATTGSSRFPKAHTCFNRLDMPNYPNAQEMETIFEGIVAADLAEIGFSLE